MLRDVLNKYEFLFNRTLGAWNKKPVDIELHSGAKPYHDKSYPAPQAHESVSHKYV